ncbi:MAG TPA: AbrB/MazE/SpoVT family DNA-binding domain-containing protein [Terrimesophilobacter sp.]|nr:AbrB/MazE/SpoVT family DNA-binding domain-containing protein [Terrimesophilobacter sp.]
MSSTHLIRVGDKGRTVIPADVRERFGWAEGSTLIALEGDEAKDGLLILSRQAALAMIRSQLAGHDPVSDLLAERRAAAAREDATA